MSGYAAALKAHVNTLTVVDVLQDVWLEQADSALLTENEEVTLMDWGNAIVRVRLALGTAWRAYRPMQCCTRRRSAIATA